ncbi:DUF5719 family protein [Microbacterium sp. LRZ72]|uniref:DUF5719 family protein n=1 Tax=Microbacterium sp. LRZ72 TaxID=2942481 RepID=UPI0029A98503|nr:DUF5719 family protein [Microbacterium sp. LRZ72]MDX2377039.1 DUF5719 family protein [Microbacterium sp. LRZ72]
MRRENVLRALTTSTRVVLAAVAVVVIVTAVVIGISVPWPSVERAPLSLQQAPTPSETVAVCPGAVLAAGRVAGDAGALSVAASERVVAGTIDAEHDSDTLTSVAAPDADGPTIHRVTPTDSEPVALAAAQSARVTDDDLAGFAAAACTAPQFESWLVAGSTSTGAADIILLANADDVAATVDVTVYTQDGATLPPGGEDVVVPAQSQIALPLSGIARGELAPVVRVQAEGAPIAASLQSTRTVTLEAVGVDVSGPSEPPATEQVIPGLQTVADADPDVAGSITARARLLAPSDDTTATVTVREVGPDGAEATPLSVPLEAGIPLELDLPGLAAGQYSIHVEASAPVVSSAWATTAVAGERDFAWMPSAPLIDDDTVLAVARASSGVDVSMRVVAADADAEVVLTPTDGGSPVTLDVPAGASVAADLPTGGTWTFETTAPVYAAVSYASDEQLGGYPVQPGPVGASAVRVVP